MDELKTMTSNKLFSTCKLPPFSHLLPTFRVDDLGGGIRGLLFHSDIRSWSSAKYEMQGEEGTEENLQLCVEK